MMLAGAGRAEQAGIMQGSSLSFAAEGWLLLICCSSVICRGKQTPRIVFRDLSQPSQVEASRPSPPPTQGGNTRTPCLRHWAYSVGHLPFKLQRYLGAGKAMQGVGLSSHYTALSPLAAFQKIQTCSKVRNKLLVFPWHL